MKTVFVENKAKESREPFAVCHDVCEWMRMSNRYFCNNVSEELDTDNPGDDAGDERSMKSINEREKRSPHLVLEERFIIKL